MNQVIRVIYLMPSKYAEIAKKYAEVAGINASSVTVENGEALHLAVNQGCDLLLAFCTGVIVEESILSKPGLQAFNVHGASPDFPGRDPHHFAHYHRAQTYGATLHYMVGKVDAGPIVDVELWPTPPDVTPEKFLEMGTQAGLKLIYRFFSGIAQNGWPSANPELSWSGKKTSRKDFTQLCRVECTMSLEEFQRRRAATDMPGHTNLYVELHGYRFKLEGPIR